MQCCLKTFHVTTILQFTCNWDFSWYSCRLSLSKTSLTSTVSPKFDTSVCSNFFVLAKKTIPKWQNRAICSDSLFSIDRQIWTFSWVLSFLGRYFYNMYILKMFEIVFSFNVKDNNIFPCLHNIRLSYNI